MIQRTLFASLDPTVPVEMYVTGTTAARTRTSIDLAAGDHVSTNTYFGRFAASYWQRWTAVRAVSVSVDVAFTQPGLLQIVVHESDARGRSRSRLSVEVTEKGAVSIPVTLDRFVDGGAVWLEFEAVSGHATVSDVRWSTDAIRNGRQAAIVICTFNRADDCAATLAAVVSDQDLRAEIDAVYVIDQGTDLVETRPSFAESATALDERLHYLRQPNLGGAGGFSRGMFEVTANDAHAADVNVIVMDDDIRCEPETVLRLNAFANYTVRDVLVGAQMLSMTDPTRLHLSAEREQLNELRAGNLTAEALEGANLLETFQEATFDAGWNGWWTCLIPGPVVRELGLSLPLFFQWDDIEYGIRARGRGFPTVTLPNAGVWHQDFHLKDYDNWSRYFSTRNGLIVASVYDRFDGKEMFTYLMKLQLRLLVSMQYGLVATNLLAIEDFLAGPRSLDDGGVTKLAQLRDLRSKYPETQPILASEFASSMDPHTQIDIWHFEPDAAKLDQVLAKRTVFQLLGRVDPRPVSIPAHYASWWHVSLFSNATVTDSGQGAVRRRRRDRDLAVSLAKRTFALCRELRKRAPELKETYSQEFTQLTSRENWARLYGLDEHP